MSEQHQGIVARIFDNQHQGKTLYSFALAGENRVYYGMGEDKPKFPEGAAIRFQFYMNNRGYPTVDGFVGKWEGEDADVAADAAKRTKESSSKKRGGYGGKGQDWKQRWISADEQRIKDKVIQLQSCRNSAIAFIDALVNSAALKMPAQAKQVGFMEELLHKYTSEFIEQNSIIDLRVEDEEPDAPEEQQEEKPTDQGVWD